MSSSESINSYHKPDNYHVEHHQVDHQFTNNTHHSNISKVHTHGEGNELVTIGGHTYYRHELMSAFGGSLNPGPAPFPKFNINPAPLGLFAFGIGCLLMGLFNARVMGITIPNLSVAVACFYAGIVSMLAGILEFFTGNTFAFTLLLSYGGFWFSYAAIFMPSMGIAAAYAESDQFENAVGLYLIGWTIWTFLVWSLLLKSTLALVVMFFGLMMTYLVMACASLTGDMGVSRAGGVIGIITSIVAFYNAFAGVATPFNSYIVPPVVLLPEIKFGRGRK
ncbi:mug86 [Candida metapsilosis]|uniref:Mug86 n=1 Tax=Candida metapsilosis TaxID=273372 RepID=A0A8H8DC41_9ASCO|nr:mug86 [Candida metapsilosis]